MKRAYLLMSLALLLAGCQNDPEGGGNATVEDLKPTQTGTTGVGGGSISGDPLNDPKHPLYKTLQARSIYFDYDSDAI